MATKTKLYGRKHQRGVNWITVVAMTGFHVGAIAALFYIDLGAILTAFVLYVIAGSLGMQTVAEGVSTEEQLKLVRDLGCDKIQGFIFSRPVTAATVKAMLGQSRTLAAA
jgi:hypothetical protein